MDWHAIQKSIYQPIVLRRQSLNIEKKLFIFLFKSVLIIDKFICPLLTIKHFDIELQNLDPGKGFIIKNKLLLMLKWNSNKKADSSHMQ